MATFLRTFSYDGIFSQLAEGGVRVGVSALSAGAYTATLFLMVNID